MNVIFFNIVTFFILFCFTLATLFFDLLFLTFEDGFVEYLSVVFWIMGILFAMGIIWHNKYKKKIVAFVLLFVCFISSGEEISWGQRIFNIETPYFIAEANRQSELNFHNLYALSGGSTWLNFFKTGEFDYQQIVDAQNLFRIGFIIFFFLFPLISNTKYGGKILSKIGYYKPENYFTIIVGLYIVFSCLITIGTSGSYAHSVQEIREMSFALFIGMYLFEFFYYTKKLKQRLPNE